MRFATVSLVLLSTSAAAQPVFTAEDFPFEPGTTYSTTERAAEESPENETAIQALIDRVGADQTWDFTTITFEDEFRGTFTVYEAPFPSELPAQNRFPEANLATYGQVEGEDDEGNPIVVDTWSYTSLTSDESVNYGGVVTGEDFDDDGDEDEVITTIEPGDIDAVFPLAYEDSWDETYTLAFEVNGEPVFDQEVSEETAVDGWGTCVFDVGSFPCLRIETTSIFFGLPTVTYEFRTQGLAFGFISGTCIKGTCFYSASVSVYEGQGTDVDEGPEATLPTLSNHPNPFADATTITYLLAAPGPVRLTVYDVLGREVAVLVDAVRPAGEGTAVFRAGDLPAGVYVYRLDAGGTTQARRMLLAR